MNCWLEKTSGEFHIIKPPLIPNPGLIRGALFFGGGGFIVCKSPPAEFNDTFCSIKIFACGEQTIKPPPIIPNPGLIRGGLYCLGGLYYMEFP